MKKITVPVLIVGAGPAGLVAGLLLRRHRIAHHIVERRDGSITLLMAEGKRKTFAPEDIDEMFETNQSSMPENLAGTMAPAEFLDIIEFLTTMK